MNLQRQTGRFAVLWTFVVATTGLEIRAQDPFPSVLNRSDQDGAAASVTEPIAGSQPNVPSYRGSLPGESTAARLQQDTGNASGADGSTLQFRSNLLGAATTPDLTPVSSNRGAVPGQLGNHVRPLAGNQVPGTAGQPGPGWDQDQSGVNSAWSSSGGAAAERNPFFQAPATGRPAAGQADRVSQWPALDREQMDLVSPLDELDAASADEEPPARNEPKRTFETSGRVETIQQRYEDGKVQIERQVTQDPEGNYFSHGTWKLFSPSGQTLADGTFQFGMMEGPWQRWHAASKEGVFAMQPFDQYEGPFLSAVNFRDGKMDGIWQIHDARNHKIMEIPYELGRRQGTATWWWPNGQKMREIRFDRNLIDGYWVEWNQQGAVVKRDEYLRGRRMVRETTEFRPGQKRSLAWFVDPKLKLEGLDNWWEARPTAYVSAGERLQHGPVALWYENGQPLMQGQFRIGQRHGSFLWWHPSGQKELSGQFDKGQKTGRWTWWHGNGMKATEGSYRDDLPVGTWTWWDTEGRVVEKKDLGGSGPGDLPGAAAEPPPDRTPGVLPQGIPEGMEEITPNLIEPDGSLQLPGGDRTTPESGKEPAVPEGPPLEGNGEVPGPGQKESSGAMPAGAATGSTGTAGGTTGENPAIPAAGNPPAEVNPASGTGAGDSGKDGSGAAIPPPGSTQPPQPEGSGIRDPDLEEIQALEQGLGAPPAPVASGG